MSSFFAFLKHDESQKELETLDKDSKDAIPKIGGQIVKLAESDELSDLNLLCQEARPILKFLKEYVYEAFLGAVHMRNFDIIEFFIKHGLGITDKPLDECIMTLTKVSKYTVNDPPVEILTILLKNGANANYMDKEKFRTPIIYACKHGNYQFVKILVENGADVNVTDKAKKMPLNYVEGKLKEFPNREEYKQIKEFLIKNGAKDKWNDY